MAIQKITADVISSDAITTASISDSAITAAKLAGTLDLTGKTITVATASSGDNDTSIASTAFVQQELASLVDSAPGTLNTLNELAAALGDDANFSTTVTNSIATKLPLAGGALTGNLSIGDSSSRSFALYVENAGSAGAGQLMLVDSDNDTLQREIRTDAGVLSFDYWDSSNRSNHLTILANGKVGIGTSSPNAKLELNVPTGDGLLIKSADVSTIKMKGSGSVTDWGFATTNLAAGDFGIYASNSVGGDPISAGTAKMYFTSTGNVGIGTASPTGAGRYLHFNSSTNVADFHITNSVTGATANDGFILRVTDPADVEYVNREATNQIWYQAGTEAMRIDTSRDLRVGTSSLGFHFDVSTQLFSTTFGTGGNLTLACSNSSGTGRGGEIFLGGSTRGDALRNVISFRNGSSSEKMRINENGTLMVGTTTNATYTHKAHFSGNANIDGVVRIEDVDGTVALSNAVLGLAYPNDSDATNGYFIYMTDGNGAIGSIQAASGTSVSFNTTSDERLKKNIVNASPQLDIIKSVKVREFDWKRNDHHELGLIAQEIKDIIPNVVSEGGDDETKNPYGVDYGKLTPYLIKAIQEQQTIIDDLKSRIETLEG